MFKFQSDYLTNTLLVFLLTFSHVNCSSQPPPSPSVKGGTVAHQNELGPILGPITKEKVLDRLKGYPICGMESEEQKLTLKVRVFPLNQTKKKEKKSLVDRTSLIEIECFFFGIQGLYDFALITPETGRLYPLSFQGAELVKAKLNGAEKQSPVAKNIGRYEVCGVPEFNAKTKTLKSLCKADPEGGCGAFAVYKLVSKSSDKFDPKSAYFEIEAAHFQSCGQPKQISPDQWPSVK